MNKQFADETILQYQKKIYGFALGKLHNIAQAEELASDIACEVYLSLLNSDNIVNVNGYIYRIASNVYARYLHKLKYGVSFADICEVSMPYNDENLNALENQETIDALRREISFLSDRQRSIVYMHYYEKKAVADIAAKLGISEGTVKWHLSDARSSLKEELTMERMYDDLAVNPIRFCGGGHDGCPGEKGDTMDVFDTQLKQNIAYACYWEPQTVQDIAKKLNVPLTYIGDEIKVLEEFGYIDRMDNTKNPKYRSNMYIMDSRLYDDTKSKMMKEAAEYFCEEWYPQIFEEFDKAEDNWGFTCADNDKNYMKYNLVMLCTKYLLSVGGAEYWKIREKYMVKRPDGGCFIAHAYITDDCHLEKKRNNPYWACGYMMESVGDHNELGKVQLDCRFTDRSAETWRDDLHSDWQILYTFIKADCNVKVLMPEEYKRLCDKGYVKDDKVQIMSYVTERDDFKENVLGDLIREKVEISKEIEAFCHRFDEKVYEYEMDKFPTHIHPLAKMYSIGVLSGGSFTPYLIETLLEKGMLKPLAPEQKKSVLTVIAYKL